MIGKSTYSVVVIEDEQIILRNLVQKIQEADDSFDVIGTARNGSDALSIIASVKPDVVFTDIKMPIMDGLELTSTLKALYPSIQVVIISGFSDFQYAQQAIALGVKEYILKPIKVEALKKTLHGIKSALDSYLYNIEKNILFSEIHGYALETPVPDSLSNSEFHLVLINLGNLCSHIPSNTVLEYFNTLWSKIHLNNIIAEIADTKWWIINGKQPNQKFIIFTENEDVSLLINKLKDILKNLAPTLSWNVCVSIKIPYSLLGNTSRNMRITLEKGIVIGKSTIFMAEDIEKAEFPSAILDTALIEKILVSSQRNNYKLLQKELFSMFDKWNSALYPQSLVIKLIHQLLKLFQTKLKTVSEAEIYYIEYELMEKMATAADFPNIYTYIWNMFLNILITADNSKDESEELIESIVDYIKDNYLSDITLDDISHKFNFSPTYLIKIFKKHSGETPVKFIIKLKISEAQRLMCNNPELDIRHIGEMVGYSDQHYFSRTFKNITGKSPSEYRAYQSTKNNKLF